VHACLSIQIIAKLGDIEELIGRCVESESSTLEAEVIRKTKIHKVLKAIIRPESVPKEEDYAFKRRSNDLLRSWGDALSADPVLQRKVLEGVPEEEKEEENKIIRMNGRLVYTDNDTNPEEKLAALPRFAKFARTSLGHGPTEVDRFGGTLLSRQCERGDLYAVKAFKKLWPSHTDLADYAGITPLQKASLGGFPHIVEHLISEGCSVHCKALDGSTPLMDAAENGHLEVVRIFLWDGHVDPTCRNNEGKRAIDLVDIEDENAKEIVSNLVKA
jgi:hypothetical protein